jgi:hypothetical protein
VPNGYNLIPPARILLLAALWTSLTCTAAAQRRGDPYRDLSKEPPLQLELGLKLHKKIHLFREPVWVKVSVTNDGEHSGMFYFQTGDALVIIDSLGTTYAPNLQVDRGISEIVPGETWDYYFHLSTFGFGLPHGEKFKGYWYLPVGRYTVLYRLHQSGVSGGTLEVESATDTFRVLEAQGEEAKALSLLVRSYDLANQRKPAESAEKLHELVNRHPNSAYVPWAMYEAAKMPQEYDELIRRYPDTGEAIAAVRRIAQHFINKKDKEGYIDTMRHLVTEYPDTEIAAEAQRRLANIQERYFRERRKPGAEEQEQGE